jgi:hypothetical protein
MRKWIIPSAVAILLLVGATGTWAGEPPEATVGSRVIVHSTQVDRAIVGTVLFIDEKDLVLRVEGRSEPMTLSRATIGLIEVLSPPEAPAVPEEPPVRSVSLSGPRVGVTYLSDGIVKKLKDDFSVHTGSVVSQFGWQFEKRHFTSRSGLTVLSEWIVLVGGMEQGLFFPSGSWLIGLRTREGLEIGVGPNLTPAGAALVLAGGVNLRSGGFNFPVNLAVVPSREGVRVSVLLGMNWRH